MGRWVGWAPFFRGFFHIDSLLHDEYTLSGIAIASLLLAYRADFWWID
jgi:hypothetical protein